MRCKPTVFSLMLVGLLTGLSWGQGSISLDGVTGLWGVDTLNVNQTITFSLRLTNYTESFIVGSTNGFRIYSPTGARWTSIAGAWTGAITSSMYDAPVNVNTFSNDGQGADTIGFGGFRLFAPGIPDNFNEVAWTISIGPIDPMYHKGQICLDSSLYRPIGFWKWSTTRGDVYPGWDGPHCFTVFDPDAPEENLPPVMEPVGDRVTNENITLAFGVVASDPDATVPVLTMASADLPAAALFTDNGDGTGTFDWTPGYFDAGVYSAVFYAVDADDAELYDSEAITITVNDVNRPPVLAPIGNKDVTAGENLNFGVSAGDPDGETPAIIAENQPGGAIFVDNSNGTGAFDWTPAAADIGFHVVRFIAVDGFDAADTELVQIQVVAPNGPPDIEPIGDFYMTECDTLSVTLSAVDPDEDLISLWVEPLADNMTFTDNDNGTGLLYFTPNFIQEGTYPLTLHASDGQLESSISFNVNVDNCQTGFIADVIIEPDFILAVYACAIEPMSATIYFGNIADFHVVSDVAVPSLLVNGTIVPTSVEIIPSMTGFDGEVLVITVPMSDFVDFYGAFRDTVVEVYSVAGSFSDGAQFITEGTVTLRGKLSGDVNVDGTVDIADITYLIAYLFGGGQAPESLLTADMDESGFVDISDLTALIEIVF